MLLGYLGKHHEFVVVMVGGAGLHWSQRCLNNAIKEREARETALLAGQPKAEFQPMRDLFAAQLKEEARSDMDMIHKELKSKSEVVQCIPLGLVYIMMMALHTEQEIKKTGIKQSEKHGASRAVDCNLVKEIQVDDEKGAEPNQ